MFQIIRDFVCKQGEQIHRGAFSCDNVDKRGINVRSGTNQKDGDFVEHSKKFTYFISVLSRTADIQPSKDGLDTGERESHLIREKRTITNVFV